MKYTSEIIIELPLARVIELFDDPDNLKHWQPGLVSFEHMSGEPGQPGAKSKLRYNMGKREMVMIETVTVRNLPHEFSGTYEVDGVFNEVKNYFVEVDGGRTMYRSISYFQFQSLMMKVVAFAMPGMFKKQSQKFLVDFKRFAEGQGK